MSNKLLDLAWKANVTHTQKLVLISLADQANDDGICWPSVSTTSQRTGLCERATRRALADLEKQGHIKRSYHTGRPTIYTVTPALDAPMHEMHPCTSCPPPLHHMQDTPAPDAYDPCTTSQHNHKEPSLNHQLTIIDAPAKAVAKKVRATRLYADWKLPEEWAEWATIEGMDSLTVRKQESIFRDYWIAKSGKDAAKLDWEATWRNWVRRHLDRKTVKAQPADDFLARHTDRSWAEGL